MSRTKNFSRLAISLLALVAAFVVAPNEAEADEDPCEGVAAKQKFTPSAEGLLALAQCHESKGKTASAWIEYLETAQIAHRAKRKETEATANARSAALASKLSRLAVMVSPAAEVEGLEVKRDGMVLDRAAWGTSAPVDPGAHVIEATAPGRAPWRQVVTVKPGATMESITVGALSEQTGTTMISSAPLDESSPMMPTPEQPVVLGRTQRITGITIGIIGVAGLAAGGYFGLQAIGHRDDATKTCPSSPCSDRAGIDLNDKAKSEATLSTIALVGGGAAVLTGAILYFTAPKAAQNIGVTAAPGYAGLTFKGAL